MLVCNLYLAESSVTLTVAVKGQKGHSVPLAFAVLRLALIKTGTEDISTSATLRLGHQSGEVTLGRIK